MQLLHIDLGQAFIPLCWETVAQNMHFGREAF
jgi:hypothetical protein